MRPSPARSATATCLPSAAEPGRRSRITSWIAPRVRRALRVHAAQRAPRAVLGEIALHHARVETVRRELARAERARKRTPLVAVRLHLDQERTGDHCLAEGHGITVASGIGTTNFPPHSRIPAICETISSLKFQGRIST